MCPVAGFQRRRWRLAGRFFRIRRRVDRRHKPDAPVAVRCTEIAVRGCGPVHNAIPCVQGCDRGGRASMMVTSRSPYRVSDRDLGMGVAVMTRRWGALPFSRSMARWTTPKRCCSSTTMSARSANARSFCNRACVPTAIFIFPELNPSSILVRCAFGMRPVTSAMSKPNGATSSRMVWACCSARISVGCH